MATEAEISALYNKYLGRDPLQSGVDAWLATNQSIDQIEQGIANSPEAAVFQAFNSTMGRDPTMDEREYFVNTNPASIEVIETVLSKTPEAKALQTGNELAETDLLADTTADDTTADDTTVGGETETAFPTADTGRFGDMIDASETFVDASQTLGVNEAQWSAFVNEVNEIKAQMNAFEGNEARVMQDRSTPDALLDRRTAVLLNQNPAMTADEARAEAEASPEYQDMVATNQQYEALQTQLNQAYASVGLDPAGRITGSSVSTPTGSINFDLNTGEITVYTKPTTGAVIKGLATAAATAGLGSALAPVLGSTALGKAGAGAISNVAGQLAVTGKVDPLSALASGVTAGINPGGTLSDSLSLAPDNVVSGFVQGATNNLVSNTITEGELDLQSAVVSGLIGAGINAGKNLLTDASNNSIEAEMERIRVTRELNNDPPLTTEQLYEAALKNANVGKSDLGGLVGEGGLLPFIEPVSTTGINNLLGGGAFLPNEVFFDSEGNRYTDLDILAGAAGEGVSPADIVSGNVEGWTSGVVTQQNTILGNAVDFAKENIPGADQLATTVSDLLDAAAAVEFKNTYGATVEEYLDAGVSLDQIKQMVAYGPLQELYNFSDNPRGTSQIVGTLSSIPGQYSTGAVNNFNVYGDNVGDVISDALNITNIQDNAATAAANANEGNIAIINLNGTDTVVSSETVLPGADTTIGDAILQGLLDGLLVDTNTNNATVSSGGKTTTQTLDGAVVSDISNVLTTAGKVATGEENFNNLLGTVTDLTNTTGGAGAAAVVDSVVGNTADLGGVDTTTTDPNAGRLSFDDFNYGDTLAASAGTNIASTNVNAGRSSFDDFSNTSDTIVNNNTTLTTNAINNANTSDTIVNNNAVLSSVDNNVTNTLSSGGIETTVPPTTVLPSVESGGGGGGGGGGESLGGGMLSGDPSPPFDIRQIGITAAPILQQRQEFPITEYLMGGLLTGNRNRVA
jgi:hypothetical protein